MTYDPNYNYDDGDMDGDGGMETEEEGGEDEDANDEYSDDDDMSWKVRRAAAKCLEAVISTRRDLLPDLYRIVSPALIARFKGLTLLELKYLHDFKKLVLWVGFFLILQSISVCTTNAEISYIIKEIFLDLDE